MPILVETYAVQAEKKKSSLQTRISEGILARMETLII